ncbi:1-deoxy-D-xylulose-5-phosphate synthase [uncultured Corynebacterium sp.]|uniref:1-deoxy-D-xylulose-5-phosphate synthase n=1 Tax=uncultured Corynebacterium sp. TaxID=159447 RepID=UPI0025FEBF9A|nr:1-deoxy-D-xylulose-5-phosphate synthase [uncultured Corynebacterium sp.]
MGLLESISSPADVRALRPEELEGLAQEIRDFLVAKVSATGGHLGPNLGVVELTMALHRVFDSPTDPIIFDTGHQAYVHKMLTGRLDDFDTLRQKDGMSGYPSRAESPHDWTESSHASAALSTADGIAKGFAIRGEHHRHVVAVVGDGALTGGMCWEALNNIASGKDRSVVVVINDNGRSYSPTIGGLAENLAALALQPAYDMVMRQGKSGLERMGRTGEFVGRIVYGAKEGLKSTVMPQEMFSELGIKYMGPVDGHNIRSLENALRHAREFGGPVIVHAKTHKGRGFAPAEANEADLMHATGVIDPVTGASKSSPVRDWTSVFSDELVEIGNERDDVVAITAAMAGPTGLVKFGAAHPDRFFDVGIAEQHALTSASGLALTGMHPVVAIYSTFLNRAFDQLLMDVALLGLPVTLVLDRAGITGSDGASHNGVWDMALTSIVPGIRVAAPRDGATLVEELREAVAVTDGPTVVRFPKGKVADDVDAVERTADGVDVLYRSNDGDGAKDGGDVLIVSVGAFAGAARAAAETLGASGIDVTVVDPRWVVPVSGDLVALAEKHSLVVVVEDGVVHAGVGSLLGDVLRASEIDVPMRQFAVPQKFLDHASRSQILDELGLTAESIADAVSGWWRPIGETDAGE